ncbi:unnamed protein product, partial [Mesorhabditis spiculigera]
MPSLHHLPQISATLRLIVPLFLLLRMASGLCGWLDHQTCDELCKGDSFWYGHCAGWDGQDFSCKCYEYKAPLDGDRCREKQQKCNKMCIKQGMEGGFCYPQRDTETTKNRTACECFKPLPQFRRRRSPRRAAGAINICEQPQNHNNLHRFLGFFEIY